MKSDCADIEDAPGALPTSRKPAGRNLRDTGTARLAKGATLVRCLHAGESLRVRGQSGMLWVTVNGDAQDYVLGIGHQACFSRPGLVVIEGLSAENEVELLT